MKTSFTFQGACAAGFLALLSVSAVTGANAQAVLGIGTAQRGVTAQYGTAIAKVVSEKSGYQMRTQALASTGQYAPRVNAGELDFGVSNIIEVTFSHRGSGMFEGRSNPNLRIAATLFPSPVTFFVSKSSGIKSAAELSKAKAPTGWNTQRLGEYLFRGFFANQDMSFDVVKSVPVTAFPRMWDLFGQGELDLAFGVLNGAVVSELEVKTDGLHYMSLDDSPAAVERMQEHMPGSYVLAEKHMASGQMVKNMAYDFVLFTSTAVKDDVVYAVVKAVHESNADLKAAVADWNPKMAAKSAVEFHPGAIKYFQEVNLWPPKQ